MREPMKPAHVPRSRLEPLDAKVARDGGSLLYLEGARYGLVTSVFEAEIVPGSGPKPHSHAYAEFFVLHEGQGRFFVDGQSIDAVAGDVVIVPPNMEHWFVNTGPGQLRHTAVHESPVEAATFKDGSIGR